MHVCTVQTISTLLRAARARRRSWFFYTARTLSNAGGRICFQVAARVHPRSRSPLCSTPLININANKLWRGARHLAAAGAASRLIRCRDGTLLAHYLYWKWEALNNIHPSFPPQPRSKSMAKNNTGEQNRIKMQKTLSKCSITKAR